MFERMGKQRKQEEKMETTRLEKNKNKLDKTTVRQNSTPWPETPNTRTTTERLDTTIQDEKKQKNIQQVLKNNKTRTDFKKHEGPNQIRELDREKGNRTTIENTTTTYSTTTTTTRLDLA